jgi:N-acetyl-anhydromuramyl-L-alanine amidase AmpD
MRPISEIIVHCTATRPEWMWDRPTSEKVAEVRRWHMHDNGWKDIGYHFLIDRDGTVAKGRPIEQVGAHTMGHNVGTIGISLFGGHGSAANDTIADNFTDLQDAALHALIVRLMAIYKIAKVSGHNIYARKACPGFSVEEWFRGSSGVQTLHNASLQQRHT